jgi:hypothetical protein
MAAMKNRKPRADAVRHPPRRMDRELHGGGITMTTSDPFLAFYEGKDAIPGDVNPYPEGSACWHAWRHGHNPSTAAPGGR